MSYGLKIASSQVDAVIGAESSVAGEYTPVKFRLTRSEEENTLYGLPRIRFVSRDIAINQKKQAGEIRAKTDGLTGEINSLL